jgi:hypothetical protein
LVAEKLKVVRIDRHDEAFQIIANREGLMGLAEICLRLAMLPENDEEAAKLGGHYHYAEPGSALFIHSEPITIIYQPSL